MRQAGRAITVRLACIDAPETAQSPWGQAARRYLQQRRPIGREVSSVVHTTDRYGRTVAEVIAEININLVLVEDGHVFAYRQYLSGCAAKEDLDAEDQAIHPCHRLPKRVGPRAACAHPCTCRFSFCSSCQARSRSSRVMR